MVARHAVTQATASYRRRFADRLDGSHFKLYNNLWFSSIGMGVYLHAGDQNAEQATLECRRALFDAVRAGCNHLDTAITHQSQLGEQALGQALASAFAKGYVSRNEIIISARGGRVLFRGNYPADARRCAGDSLRR